MISNFITKLAQQLAISLFAVPLASAQTSPAADMQLITDLHHMQVQVNQSAPLPPGGCNSGYTWHTTYGGCRTPKPETETEACAANHTGSRTRTRTGYTLQANSSDIKYGQWGAWAENCKSQENDVIPASGYVAIPVHVDAGGLVLILEGNRYVMRYGMAGPNGDVSMILIGIFGSELGPYYSTYLLKTCKNSHIKDVMPQKPTLISEVPGFENRPFASSRLERSHYCHKN